MLNVQQTKIKLAIHCELNKKSRKNQTVLINSSRKFKIGQSFPKKVLRQPCGGMLKKVEKPKKLG